MHIYFEDGRTPIQPQIRIQMKGSNQLDVVGILPRFLSRRTGISTALEVAR